MYRSKRFGWKSGLLLCTFLIISLPFFAQEGEYNYYTGAPLTEAEQGRLLPDTLHIFGPEESLEVRVISDMARLSADKFKDEYQSAMLEIRIADSVMIRRAARIKARGKSRLRTCDFPPIKLNLKGTRRIFSNLAELEKLKVVNLCFLNREAEDYLYKEYLIYKMYQMLTDTSFKVRMIRTTFVHSHDEKQTIESIGFLIEDGDNLANRLSFEYKGGMAGALDQLDKANAIQVALFQYMVGNADYSMEKALNMKAVEVMSEEGPRLIPVPYDFDSSGLVDADYAKPNPDYYQNDVKDRVYLGPCLDPADFKEAFAPFLALRQEWFDLIRGFEPLDKKPRRQMIEYLRGFFEIINEPDAAKANFTQAPYCFK